MKILLAKSDEELKMQKQINENNIKHLNLKGLNKKIRNNQFNQLKVRGKMSKLRNRGMRY